MFKRAGLALALAAGLLGALRGAASASCVGGSTVYSVPSGPAPSFGTIQAAINNIPAGTLTADYCISLISAGPFNENIFIGNHPSAGFSIIITTAGGVGQAVIAPTGAGPAFDIENDSVTLAALAIRPGASGVVTYGVFSTTATAVVISSVVVDESGGFPYTQSPAEIANQTNARYSIFTTAGANPGLLLNGTGNTIQFSTITSRDTTNKGALAIPTGSSNNLIFRSYVFNNGSTPGVNENGMVIATGGNTISSSTVGTTAPDFNSSAIFMTGTGNVISTSTIISSVTGGGYGLYLQGSNNFVYGSTITSNGSEAVYFPGSTNNLISGTVMSNTNASGVQLDVGAANNIIDGSTVTCAANGCNAIWAQNSAQLNTISNSYVYSKAAGVQFLGSASSNTVTTSFVYGFNAFKVNGGSFNTLSLSTAATNTAGQDAVLFQAGSGNAVVASYISDSLGGNGINLSPGNKSVVANSTVVVNGSNYGINLNATYGSTITASVVFSSLSSATILQNGAVANLLDRSTFTTIAGGGVYIGSSGNNTFNTIFKSYVFGNTANGLEIDGDASNAVSGSTIASMIPVGLQNGALVLSGAGATGNTVSGSVILNTGPGDAVLVTAGAQFNLVASSTMSALGSSGSGLDLSAAAFGNQFQHDYFSNPSGGAALIQSLSAQNTVSGSTFAANGLGSAGLLVLGSSTNTFTLSDFQATGGAAALEMISASSNTVSFSTIAAHSSQAAALVLTSLTNNNAISSSYIENVAGSSAVFVGGGSSNNSIIAARIAANSAVQPAVNFGGTFVGAANDASDSIVVSSITNLGGDGVWLSSGSLDVVKLSTVTAAFGAKGIVLSRAQGAIVDGNVVQASTCVFVSGSTSAFVTGNALYAAIGIAGDAIDVVNGGGTITIGSNTTNTLPSKNFALLDNNVGPLTVTGYLVLRGTIAVSGPLATFNDGPYPHLWGGGIFISGPAFNGNGDSITLDGANDVPPAPSQTITFPNAATIGSLNVNDPWVLFGSPNSLTATTFNDLRPASTVTFAANGTYNLTNFNIYGAPGGIINLNMGAGTPPWNLGVTNSSVTLAQVSQSNEIGGVVKANDGHVFDLGGNTNWGFQPQLYVQMPGQGWIEGAGYAGPANIQTAGVPFNVLVRAVSYSSTTVSNAAMSVTLTGSDPFQNPGNGSTFLTQPLVSGATTFSNITASSAEPAGLALSFGATGAPALASYANASATLNPGPLNHLQIVIPSEQPNAGSTANGGKLNSPDVQIASRPISSVLVRAVDAFNNLENVTDQVAIIGTNSSTATWPSLPQALSSGQTVFASTVTFYSTGTYNLTVKDVTNGLIPNAVSANMVFSILSLSSPTVALNVNMSTVTTLGGGLSGYAFDSQAVSKVLVSLENGSGLRYYNFPVTGIGSFVSATPVFATATLQGQGAYVNWSIPLSDNALANRTSYYLEMRALNGSNNVTVSFATFTFLPGLLGVGAGGEGTAALLPAISSGCEPALLQMVYTVGPSGLQPGGKVQVTFPPGWTGPNTVAGANPPLPGQAFVASSNGAALAAGSAQCSAGTPQNAGASLCAVQAGTPGFNTGDTITFILSALPPIGPTGRGPQLFNVQSSVDGTAPASGIPVQPVMTLNQGTTAFFTFADPAPLSLGPLQTSATMQLEMVDLCGNPVSTSAVVTATVTIQAPNGLDTTAVVYATSSAGGVIVSSVTFWANHSFSNSFYYETSTGGITFETIHATGMVAGMLGTNYSEANRSVSLLVSSLTFSGISIDSATVNPGETTSTISYVGAATPAYIRFTPSVSGAPWSVLISSDPVGFSPAVFQAGGQTTAGQPINVSWNGVNTVANPPQFVPAGVYYVLLRGAFGAVQDTSLRVYIPQSPSISGNLGSKGAGSIVSISGPGAGFGNQGVATSTGYFQVFGLIDQQFYAVQASTAILVSGQPITLTTGTVGAQALAAGGLIPGTLSFPTTAFIRVSVTLPQPAPSEFSGSVQVFNSSGAPAALGNLHFYAGLGSSDNGAQAFGQAASTWTTLLVTPDTYTVVAKVSDLRISTQIANVLVNQYATVDLPIVFQKKTNVYGFVTIPSTTPFGAAVSVSAQMVGVSSPSVFANAFVQPWSNGFNYSSAPYALYGLDPGTWTITAKNVQFLSTAAVVVVSSNADVGDATFLTPGLALPLSNGGVISGQVTINGDTTQQNQCITVQNGFCPPGTFEIAVQVYNQQTFQTSIVPIRLVKDPAVTSSTFSVAGLASGSYVVQTALGGWGLTPAGGQIVVVSTPAVSAAALTLNAGSVSTTLNIKLPPNPSGGCHPATDAHNVGIWGPIYFGNGGRDIGYPDVVTSEIANSTVAIFCSSMTVTIPPQNNGFETITVTYIPTGASARQVLSPVQGAATALNFDLSQPTVTVSGKVTFSGTATLAFSTYSVSVSTLGGILQVAPTNYFCVVTATNTIPVSTLHLELIPLDPLGKGSVPPLRDYGFPFAGGALGCNPETAFGGVWGLMGYVAQIQSDGSFSFPGVSAGVYRLRNYANLDLNPARGAEIGFFEQDIAITTNTTNLVIPISQGFNVSGLLVLPPGMTASRTFQLSLIDSHGNPVAQMPVTFNGTHAVPFTFTNTASGEYSINVLDYGQPYSFAAAPLTVRVVGSSLNNQNIQLQPAGTIRASIGIQQTLSDGSKQFINVTHANSNLLPNGLLVDAIATPWVQGGYFRAQSVNCSSPLVCFGANPGPLTIDPNTDEMQIIGLLPGTYNVEFIVPAGVSAGPTGGLSLVSTVRSGVTVGPGQTVDLGVVGLTAGVALTGKVTDAKTSAPLSGIRMLARPSIAQSGQVSARAGFQLAFTDRNGQYNFSALDPTVRYYDVFAANRTSGQQGDVVAPYEQQISQSIDVQSTSTLNFALNFASYSVSGQVIGRPGDQLVSGVGQSQGASPGATIMMQKVGVTPTANPIADIVLQTDAQGNFTVPALTAGQYLVYALALNYGTYQAGVTISTASLSLGTIQLGQGATLSGSIRKVDGTAPSEDDIQTVVGAATDLSDYFFGRLTRDPQTRGVTGYELSGFKPGKPYRVIFVSVDHEVAVPPEVANVVFASSAEARAVDVTFTPKKPFVTAKASRDPLTGDIKLRLHSSQPFRERLLSDDNFSTMLTTLTAQGSISTVTLSVDRRELTAFYTPGVSESSFTLQLSAYSAVKDPASIDPVNPEFVIFSTPTFFLGTDGASALNINNIEGGGLVMEGDQGRVTLPKGAFSVDVSSGLSVIFQKSNDQLAAAKLAAAGVPTVQANIQALRYKPAAYPSSLFQAMAALPPQLSPFSAFYDVLLPLGVRTALAQPVQMTVSYSTSTPIDPTKLNLYWFNAAANAYVLQQDVTGAAPVIDTVNHTITINVNHFSTFVLFNAGVNVITGASFGGGEITAYNFPNPFDLTDKTVTSIHPGAGAAQNTVRGTMISIGLPPDISGEGKIKIFNVAGERVRTMDLGSLAGGAYYYQPWDGRNDSGRDVASGVYIGQVLVGGKSKFFKMALIK